MSQRDVGFVLTPYEIIIDKCVADISLTKYVNKLIPNDATFC